MTKKVLVLLVALLVVLAGAGLFLKSRTPRPTACEEISEYKEKVLTAEWMAVRLKERFYNLPLLNCSFVKDFSDVQSQDGYWTAWAALVERAIALPVPPKTPLGEYESEDQSNQRQCVYALRGYLIWEALIMGGIHNDCSIIPQKTDVDELYKRLLAAEEAVRSAH